jgi:hypothetical protein
MNGSTTRSGMGWPGRLLIGLVLILAGAATAVWGLAHYQPAARVLGVATVAPAPVVLAPKPVVVADAPTQPAPPENSRVAALEQRLAAVENATHRAEGSAGRADALVITFAARRAIDRGVALGYLENLLNERFGAQHQAAVATIITASRQPVRLNDLIDQYQTLGPDLRRGGPQDNWWTNFKREMGSLVEVHRADEPSVSTDARFARALQRLQAGDVDRALAETMRLPGAARAEAWTAAARRYIAAHRALDEIESAALLPSAGGA